MIFLKIASGLHLYSSTTNHSQFSSTN
uniref:Uncharacterized protein n=1 Tax=Lepeophtheirus salmonis TaxID=72036 RepID=A0A0K2TE75_LEPSM